MQGLIQRVTGASVSINNQVVGEIQQGLLLLLGVERIDDEKSADKLLKKVTSYRVFSDENDKMNLSLNDIGGELLIVSQFTLAANTEKGLRPSFSSAAAPEQAKAIYNYFVNQASKLNITIACGQFGADMQVSLCNDGPVTFLLTS
ncbi:D-tyrosyl-tRNA(Tyr) deacylase [Pseudoalteromonas sp. MMG010]|uniref:D-aminoacyl-tRNA deacylase n=1 Tax=Pseudoalteromonas sp. MMG010 TaxID=2822685 RepID=UPI001B3A571C|nr:D-aminoacyl-tRNA deacylase [Pseudoalteromonas sp. MMG010]MBQ4834629.1 D-tyrosyl-tRNA(Tyr) deacylase [Pseudoalteromonas sp. MMG010]